MTCTPAEARDEIYTLFTDKWNAATLRNPMPEIRYQGREKGDIPKGAYVRLSMQHVSSPQAAFIMSDEPGASPAQYETSGLLFVQVFMPSSERDGYYEGELLATFARDIFRNSRTPSGVWFRNSRFNELDPDGSKYRWNVKAEFEYDEISGEGN